jgi:O-antigen ligase
MRKAAITLLVVFMVFLAGYFTSVYETTVFVFMAVLMLAILIFRYPFVGLLLFVGMIPLESAFFSLGGGTTTYTRLLGLYLMILWVLKLMVERRRIVIMPYAKWLLPFLLLAAVSILWISDKRISIQYLLTLIQMVPLGLIVYNEVNDRKQLCSLLMVLLTSCMLTAVLGYFRTNPLDPKELLTLGAAGVKEYASIVGLAFLSCIILYSTLQKRNQKNLALIAATICIYPLFMSGERGVFLSLLIGWFAIILIGKRKLDYIVITGLVFLMLYGAFQLAVRQGLLNSFQVSRFNLSQIIETGGSGRVDIWRVGLQMFREHPLTGVGFGNFTKLYGYFGQQVSVSSYYAPYGPHSDFLGIAAELGIVGLFFFVGLLMDVWVRFARFFRQPLDPEIYVFATWIGGILVYYLSIGLTSVFLYRKLYWLIIVLTEVIIKIGCNVSTGKSSVFLKYSGRNIMDERVSK